MNIKQFLLLVAALTVAAVSFAQSPEITQRQSGVSVDSTTTCTPREDQSSAAGSFSANTRTLLSSTLIESPVAVML